MVSKLTAKELSPEAQAAVLKEFQNLTDYAQRKAFYEANPFLARIYCAGNFPAHAPANSASTIHEK